MSYQPDLPATSVPSQEAPYKVTKGGIYLKAGLAIAFSNQRTALVYDPKSYVAVESKGNFSAISRRVLNNTDCDCERNQVCVNGKCVNVPRNAEASRSSRGNPHVNGQQWTRTKACSSAKVRLQGRCPADTDDGTDACPYRECPAGEVLVRGGSPDCVCVPYEPGDKGIKGILQVVSW